VHAFVPTPAIGFEIKTPFTSAVDRGTDFTIQVNEEQAEISVVKGRVDLCRTGTPDISVTTGNGQKYSSSGMSQPITARLDRYIDHTMFQGLLDLYVQRVEQKQTELAIQMEKHPNLLVRFLLNNGNSSEIVNRSQRGSSTTDKALVQHCIMNEGSLPGSQSLRFNRRDSGVTFTLPAKTSDLTMIASVCVDQPKNQGNVLASSNEHGRIPGSFLWQLAADGRFFFQITDNRKEIDFFQSPVVLTPAKRYTWSQIALVADSNKKEIRFYQDGKQVGRREWSDPIPLIPGAMTLGNAAQQENLTARFLNGAMENFALFDRALSDEEIRNLTYNY
ncbi:MAG: LamG-like jellyroll fold domain-containing protein, partial [Planctomycetia bacterium]|nr:LamG-like jellyroll fold domain-containing protein [Planctomycetia bacterium]